jgi:DNA ligase-1
MEKPMTSIIKKPMKAPSTGASLAELQAMEYPIVCSAKLDGIRGVKTHNGVMSNSMKLLGNKFMQERLNSPYLDGLDGELIVGLPHVDFNIPDDDVFNRTSGAIRRSSGEPDFKFYVFDDFTNKDMSYADRWINPMAEQIARVIDNPYVIVLAQRICNTWQEAIAYEEELIEMGYEGMMARTLSAPYKEGRATPKQGYILKRKPLEQDEGKIVGCFEQMKNNNEKAVNEMGDSYRTAHKENKEGKDTLGGFILKSPLWKETFNCGTIIGGTDVWRKEIWEKFKTDPDSILGNYVTYVYQGIGSIDKPRQPRGKAEFRGKEDM